MKTLYSIVALSSAILSFNAEALIRSDFDNGGTLPKGFDNSSGLLTPGFQMRYGDQTYDTIRCNSNGIVALGELDFFPRFRTVNSLEELNLPVIAPYYADVNTNINGSVYYGSRPIAGVPAYGCTWDEVSSFHGSNGFWNTFQAIFIDRSDTGPGNFDVEFNYQDIYWQASGSSTLFYPRVGFSEDNVGELPGSGMAGAFVSPGTLPLNRTNFGRQEFRVRGGTVLRKFYDESFDDDPNIQVEDHSRTSAGEFELGDTITVWSDSANDYRLIPVSQQAFDQCSPSLIQQSLDNNGTSEIQLFSATASDGEIALTEANGYSRGETNYYLNIGSDEPVEAACNRGEGFSFSIRMDIDNTINIPFDNILAQSSGDVTFYGSTGTDLFVITDASSTVLIYDFQDSIDRIQFLNTGIRSVEDFREDQNGDHISPDQSGYLTGVDGELVYYAFATMVDNRGTPGSLVVYEDGSATTQRFLDESDLFFSTEYTLGSTDGSRVFLKNFDHTSIPQYTNSVYWFFQGFRQNGYLGWHSADGSYAFLFSEGTNQHVPPHLMPQPNSVFVIDNGHEAD